jgi:hypothetical protein
MSKWLNAWKDDPISEGELEAVREINRKLPFAHPIQQGPVVK